MSNWNPLHYLYTKEEKPKDPLSYDALAARINATPRSTLVISAFAVGAVTSYVGVAIYRRYFRRIPNVEFINSDMFKQRKWIKGKVVR